MQKSNNSTVGGIVGRNVHGYVTNSTFNGKLLAQHVGGIIGADYKAETVQKVVSGSGSVTALSKDILTTYSSVKYVNENGADIENFINLKLGENTLTYLSENLNNFYTHEVDGPEGGEKELKLKAKAKLFGLFIGLTDEDDFDRYSLNCMVDDDKNPVTPDVEAIKIELVNKELIINGIGATVQEEIDITIEEKTKEFVSCYAIDSADYNNLILYVIGFKVTSFDSWMQADFLSDNNIVYMGKVVKSTT